MIEMPIRIDDDLPVKKTLEDENIFVMGTGRAHSQDIRPLDILILNLMPLKEDTELQLMRSLSNTPLQVNITLLRTMSYEFDFLLLLPQPISETIIAAASKSTYIFLRFCLLI